mmetsp:Transcript_26577/g.74338  ORF Transcript_26577/g.74338 Transcript_26577/m.74338 type:complete len:202 (+) Transcript_26577:763-1368(+)
MDRWLAHRNAAQRNRRTGLVVLVQSQHIGRHEQRALPRFPGNATEGRAQSGSPATEMDADPHLGRLPACVGIHTAVSQSLGAQGCVADQFRKDVGAAREDEDGADDAGAGASELEGSLGSASAQADEGIGVDATSAEEEGGAVGIVPKGRQRQRRQDEGQGAGEGVWVRRVAMGVGHRHENSQSHHVNIVVAAAGAVGFGA